MKLTSQSHRAYKGTAVKGEKREEKEKERNKKYNILSILMPFNKEASSNIH